jgi:hypothetical protein
MWLAVFLFFLSGILTAQCKLNHPAPFQKAKELALTCPKNQYGDHVWIAQLNDNGNSIEYRIMYGIHKDKEGNHDIVVLIKSQGSAWIGIGHCSTCDDYKAASNKTDGYFVLIDQKIALQAAFVFFNELVQHKLI